MLPVRACLVSLLALAASAPLHALEAQPAPAEEVQRFDVMEFEIAGNTVLPVAEVERAVYPFLGPQRTFAEVNAASQALQEAYRRGGYQTVIVDIPEQRVGSGVIKLQVLEGSVERVKVAGARYYDQGRILAQAPSLQEGAVPYFPDVQRDLAELNRSPGRRVLPVLRPGRTPGTTEFELKVEDKPPLSASLELNNHYSPNTSRLRLSGSTRYDNLFQREHSVSLQFQTTPEESGESEALSASYVLPMGGGDALALYAVRSTSNVAALGTTTVLGNGTIYGLRAIFPLSGMGRFNHSLVAGLDYKDFKENLLLAGEEAVQTPIRYMPVSLTYNGSMQAEKGSWEFSTGVSVSLRNTVGDENLFENKRFNAGSNFFVFKWDLAHTRQLSEDFALHGRIDGQVADQPLVSNEQYVAGGAGSVRGYLQAEGLGDNAFHGALELRGPSLAGEWAPRVQELRPHAFIEGARLQVRNPLPSQKERTRLSSAGFGLTVRALDRFSLTLDVGWPFQGTNYTEARKPRVHFNSALSF